MSDRRENGSFAPRRKAPAALLVAAVVAAGCAHVGPRTVVVDRFDYSASIAESWKQQTLLNIVKLRYMDLPVFVDVSSIVAGYSLQTGISVNGVVSTQKAVQGNYVGVGGQAVYTDRPTITYVPMTGEKFLHSLMTPIDPKNIFFMLQSGYAADFVLALTVEGLNGLRNRSITGGVLREADPEFLRVLQLLREVQAAGGFGMRVEETPAKRAVAVVFFQGENTPTDVREKTAEIRRLLGLPADQQRFVLTYSPMRGTDGELAVSSRSMLQILAAFSTYLDVPREDLDAHRAIPAFENVSTERPASAVRIHSGESAPADAFAAVNYRGHWFWVDDGDFQTKRALTAVMFFFTLAESGGSDKLPLITIPAQ